MKIIPWLEVNNATNKELAECVEGIGNWARITDTAIVTSTADHYKQVYEHLKPERLPPGFTIVPGLKGSSFQIYPQLEGPWNALAEAVEDISGIHWTGTVVLEMETLLKEYAKGNYDMDWGRLHEGLVTLRFRGAKYWWWPGARTSSIRTLFRYHALNCAVCRALPNTRFFDRRFDRPTQLDSTIGQPTTKLSYAECWPHVCQAVTQLTCDHPIPILYCYGWTVEPTFWSDEGVADALKLIDGPLAVLYPGQDHWPKGSKTISEAIVKAG